jgi:hypothetical protein
MVFAAVGLAFPVSVISLGFEEIWVEGEQNWGGIGLWSSRFHVDF